MAHKQITTVLNGTTYQIGTLPLAQARAVLVRLTKAIGPAVGELLANVKSLKSLGDLDVSALGPAIQDFCLRLSDEDLAFLSETFAPVCMVGRPPVPLDKVMENHFAGNFAEMFEWLYACVAHNYGDFSRLLAKGPAFRSAPPAGQTTASE